MIPWIGLLITIPIVHVITQNKNEGIRTDKYKTKIGLEIIILGCILFLFRVLRNDTVGGDLATYKALFYYVGRSSWAECMFVNPGYEKGFLLLNKLLYTVYPSFRILIVFTAIIYTVSLVRFIHKYSCEPWLSIYIYIAMYFLGATFNNERQAIAIAILFWGFDCIEKKKFWKFLFYVMLATTIHMTSIVFIVLYFVVYIKIDFKYWTVAAVSAVVIYTYGEKIIEYLINNYYTKYQGVDLKAGGGYSYLFLLSFFVCMYFILYRKEFTKDNSKVIFVHMMVISVVLQTLSLRMGFFVRLVNLFASSMIIYLPDLFMKFTDKSRHIIKAILCLVVAGWFIYSLSHDSLGVVPYTLMRGE